LSGGNGGNFYGENKQIFTLSFGMKRKRENRKNNTGTRARKMDELWSMLEHFWIIHELNIEETCCQA
jgi:hypothetical protein